MFIFYERYSYYIKDDINTRITFDFNARYRTINLNLDNKDNTSKILNENLYIMEIKSLDRIPMFLANILSKLKIYPSSFSKYKEAYLIGVKE